MYENCASFGSDTGLLIQYRDTLFLHFCECRVNVLYFQADVMEAFAAFFQKLGEAGIGCGWLDQFDLASARATHGEKSDTYLFGRYFFYFTGLYAKGVTIEAKRLFYIAHDDGNVVNTFRHVYLPGCDEARLIAMTGCQVKIGLAECMGDGGKEANT